MKHFFTSIFAIFLAATFAAVAQVTVTVVTRNPMPASVAEWQRDRSLFQIILLNPPGSPEIRDARLSFIVREAGGSRIIAQSQDNSINIPRFTIPAGASTVVRTGPDIIREDATTIDPSLRSTVTTTNSIPEGNYEFCVRVFDAQNKEIGASGELCSIFSVLIPDPPSLILPANGDLLPAGTLPVFTWTPVLLVGQQAHFKLRIVPLFEGQNSRTAIDGNPILFERDGISGVSFQYTPAFPRFGLYPTATGFAWQIQALGANGKPATRNNGKSEIFTFKFGKGIFGGGGGGFGNDSSGGRSGRAAGSAGASGSGSSGSTSGGSSGGNVISLLTIGEFTLALDAPKECKGECTLEGGGKIFVPVLGDSIAVRFSGLGVRRLTRGAEVVSGEIRAQLPAPKHLRFNTVDWEIKSLRWTSENASFDGRCTVDWSELGLGGGFGFASVNGAAITLNEIPLQSHQISLARTGRESGFGECLRLGFDSLSFAISTASDERVFSGSIAGEVSLPCLQTSDGAVRGRFSLPLDKPDGANLLLTLKSPLKNVQLPGLPLTLSADNLLLDISGDANFTALTTSNTCLYAESWSNPLWRGIIIPNGQFGLATEDGTISIPAQNAVLEPSQNGLALSVRATSVRPQQAKLGGFRFAADTVTLEICRQTVQKAALSGKIFLPQDFAIPSAASNFDNLRVRLSADEKWNWRGAVEPKNPARLPFGAYGTAEFTLGAVTIPSNGKKFIEWTQAALLFSEADASASLSGVRFTSDGSVEFGEKSWKRSTPVIETELTGLPIAATEIGFGYAERQWWFGISGDIILPEESGLGIVGGMKVKRMRVAGNEKFTVTSDETTIRLFAGNHLEMNGTIGLGAITGAGFGLKGRLDAKFGAFGGAMLPVEFALGRGEGGRLFWYAVGSSVFSEPPAFAPSFSLFGGAFGAGWNVRLTGCDSSAVESSATILPPTIAYSAAPFSMRAGLLIGEASRRLFRLAATAVCPSGSQSGTLANNLEISGNAVVQPAHGFARGYLAGQITAKGSPLRLTGTAELHIIGATIGGAGFSVESGSTLPSLRFNGISGRLILYQKISIGIPKPNKSADAGVIQFTARNATLAVNSAEAIFGGNIIPLVAIGGVSSGGSAGYVIAEGETEPCTRLTFVQDNTSAVSVLSASFEHKGTALAGLDALPCAGALSVAAAQDIASRHRSADGTWEMQPIEMQPIIPATADCGATAISGFTSTTAAIRLTRRAEAREVALRSSGSESASLSLPMWNDNLAADPTNVRITSSFAGNTWEIQQDAPPFRSCAELTAATTDGVVSCDIRPVADGRHFGLRNAGTTVVAKGSRVAVLLKFQSSGTIQDVAFEVELTGEIAPGAEYPIDITRFTAPIAGQVTGAVMQITPLAPLSQLQPKNDCASFGTLSCP